MISKKYPMVSRNMSLSHLSCQSMRKQTLVLLATLAAVSVAKAQQSDEDSKPQQAPVENLYFSTDEFIYIPEYTLNYGFRTLSGAKGRFSGTSTIKSSSVNIGDNITALMNRSYHDGFVSVDRRLDASGSTVAADGSTNTWGYTYDSQGNTPGYVQMHTYEATTIDAGPKQKDFGNTFGVEVVAARDLRKLGAHILWNITGGICLNDITQKTTRYESARVTTITDLYSLDGAGMPARPTQTSSTTPTPYTSPSTQTVPEIGTDGQPIYTDPPNNNTQKTQTINTTTLLKQFPSARLPTSTTMEGSIKNQYKLKGSFYTMRLGPTFVFPITAKLRISTSIGGVLVYAGGTFTVDSEFTPLEGDVITDQVSSVDKNFAAGYYVDANVEYWLTERTGFYAGGVHQSSGSYTQNIRTDSGADYSTRVDLSNLSGFRAGMNYRF